MMLCQPLGGDEGGGVLSVGLVALAKLRQHVGLFVQCKTGVDPYQNREHQQGQQGWPLRWQRG